MNMERSEVLILKIRLRRNRGIVCLVFVFLVILMICMFWGQADDRNEEARCYICEGLPHHAPCLIDLATGGVLELSVYDNDPVVQGELSENQTTGHVTFTMSGGMTAIGDAGVSSSAVLPTESRELNAALFCDECKAALASIPNQGVVLADLYDLENIQYFPIAEGASYTCREYQISIEMSDGSEELQVFVSGAD